MEKNDVELLIFLVKEMNSKRQAKEKLVKVV